jgi:glycosyltransferase involved in cell wall biosynthesis
MRVLWLCSSPALGAPSVSAPLAEGGGWVAALEGAIRQRAEVSLSVAFPWDVRDVQHAEEGAYLPFPKYPRGGRLRQLLFDQSCRLEPEREVKHLERVVALSRPDLVHVWGTEPFFGLVAERIDAPVLIEIQGVRTYCAEAYCSGLTRLDLLRHGSPKHLLNGRSLLHTLYRYQKTAVREQRILRSARWVSGRTTWDRQACTTLAPGATYFHCDRLLRPAFYQRAWSLPPQARELRILSTLRGNAYKGVETIAECARLLRSTASRSFEWTLLGIRPGEEIHRVVERKLGLSFERLGIHLAGRMTAEAVAEALCGSDLYVQSSRIENSPNGLCEAMIVGLPAIATDVGGTSSLLTHGADGLLIPPGDAQAMAGAIEGLAAKPDLAARLGRAARQRARRRHDPSTVVDTLTSIYRQILAASSEAAPPG